MQKHIASWELLAQFALTFCINAHLPKSRGPIACHQGTDNSAADAASAKGLSMTKSMAAVLASYFTFMCRFHIFAVISHIPGHVNELADSLSRFKQPLPVELSNAVKCEINWQSLLDSAAIFISQSGRQWPQHFSPLLSQHPS